MLRDVDLARPFVSLVINRGGFLSRGQTRFFNRDNYMRDAVTSLLIARYNSEGVSGGVGNEDEESGLLRFLNWLIENQEAIKSFIEMIMTLFGVSEDGTTSKVDTSVLGPITRI